MGIGLEAPLSLLGWGAGGGVGFELDLATAGGDFGELGVGGVPDFDVVGVALLRLNELGCFS